METNGLSRAQGSMFASEASNPRSGRDIDAEHGSGRADPEGTEFGRGKSDRPQGETGARGPGLLELELYGPVTVFSRG